MEIENHLKTFEKEINNIFLGYPSVISEEMIYVLSYLYYKLNNDLLDNSINYFSREEKFEGFINYIIRIYSSYKCNLTATEQENIENCLDYLNSYNYFKINNIALINILRKYDKKFYQERLRCNIFKPFSELKIKRDYITTEENIKILKCFANKIESIFDIGCGLGNTLVSFKNEFNQCLCGGTDINPRAALITSIRLDSYDDLYHVYSKDIFEFDKKNKYSLITCNMPFGLRLDRYKRDEIIRQLNKELDVKFNPASSLEWLYVYKGLNMLNKDGRFILICPGQPLFKDGDFNLRKDLIDKNLIEYVIELPKNVYPLTNINYYFVVLNKTKKDDRVKFVNASSCVLNSIYDGKLDVDKVIEFIHSNNEFVKEIKQDIIKKKDYLLTPSSYFQNYQKSSFKNGIKLSELNVEVIRGYQLFTKKDSCENGKYSIITVGDIDDNGNISKVLNSFNTTKDVEKFKLRQNDILITNKGTKIKTSFVKELLDNDILFQGNLTVIRVNDKRLNPLFLKIYLDSNRGKSELDSIQTGVSIITLNLNKLSNIEIPLFSIEQQNKIVFEYEYKKNEIDLLDKKLSELKSNLKDNVDLLFEEEIE